MATMTKAQKAEQAEAIDKLRGMIPPGATVSTILRHVSRSGMSRSISVIWSDEDGPDDISWLVARAMGDKIDQTHGGVKMGGCGMDMGFALVYNLSRTLYPTYACLGRGTSGGWGARCPSNVHVNHGDDRDNYGSDVVHTDGYCLSHRWI